MLNCLYISRCTEEYLPGNKLWPLFKQYKKAIKHDMFEWMCKAQAERTQTIFARKEFVTRLWIRRSFIKLPEVWPCRTHVCLASYGATDLIYVTPSQRYDVSKVKQHVVEQHYHERGCCNRDPVKPHLFTLKIHTAARTGFTVSIVYVNVEHRGSSACFRWLVGDAEIPQQHFLWNQLR